MKKYLTLLLLWVLLAGQVRVPGPGGASPTAGTNGFTGVKTITIDHTKVGSSSHTDFPMLFSSTLAYLKTTGNGGDVNSSAGNDIVFYPNSNCSGTKLDHEVEFYDATTGQYIAHVRAASVSNATDTVFYMCYGKASIAGSSQQNATGVWDSNFNGVYHFGSSSSLVPNDSTLSARNLTVGSVSAAAGKVHGGAAFAANASLNHTEMPSSASITVEWWQNVPTSGLPTTPYSFAFGSSFSTSNRISAHAPYGDSTVYWDYGTDTIGGGRVTTSYSGNFDAWKHIALVYNSSSNLHAIYINGSLANSNTSSNAPSLTGIWIGTDNTNSGCCYMRATIDEFRISSVARSVDWILATFNNHNSPSTFYTVS